MGRNNLAGVGPYSYWKSGHTIIGVSGYSFEKQWLVYSWPPEPCGTMPDLVANAKVEFMDMEVATGELQVLEGDTLEFSILMETY